MPGLYVHIPFCLRKCKYCDFNSFALSKEDKEKYLSALFEEMEEYRGEKCDTVFLGGGTPTALDRNELKELIEKIQTTFTLSEDCEFTAEANPNSADFEKLALMRKMGVNRLSIGVQSFNDSELAALGRLHSAREAEETVAAARKCGFENISIDLMSAIPGQNMESFKRNLDIALKQNTEHISCYSLILEEGTPLYAEYEKGALILVDEDEEREMYELAVKELEKAGYIQYEISNFAKPGYKSRHNIKYWRCEDYIGVGISAHSYADGVRYSNTGIFKDYVSGKYKPRETEVLCENDKISEFMFLGLRMTCGISKEEFFEKFGKNIYDVYGKQLSKFKKMGMIEEENECIRLSHRAVSVSNQIMCEFLL